MSYYTVDLGPCPECCKVNDVPIGCSPPLAVPESVSIRCDYTATAQNRSVFPSYCVGRAFDFFMGFAPTDFGAALANPPTGYSGCADFTVPSGEWFVTGTGGTYQGQYVTWVRAGYTAGGGTPFRARICYGVNFSCRVPNCATLTLIVNRDDILPPWNGTLGGDGPVYVDPPPPAGFVANPSDPGLYYPGGIPLLFASSSYGDQVTCEEKQVGFAPFTYFSSATVSVPDMFRTGGPYYIAYRPPFVLSVGDSGAQPAPAAPSIAPPPNLTSVEGPPGE